MPTSQAADAHRNPCTSTIPIGLEDARTDRDGDGVPPVPTANLVPILGAGSQAHQSLGPKALLPHASFHPCVHVATEALEDWTSHGRKARAVPEDPPSQTFAESSGYMSACEG